jgi:hypothetical protein
MGLAASFDRNGYLVVLAVVEQLWPPASRDSYPRCICHDAAREREW